MLKSFFIFITNLKDGHNGSAALSLQCNRPGNNKVPLIIDGVIVKLSFPDENAISTENYTRLNDGTKKWLLSQRGLTFRTHSLCHCEAAAFLKKATVLEVFMKDRSLNLFSVQTLQMQGLDTNNGKTTKARKDQKKGTSQTSWHLLPLIYCSLLSV